MPLAILGAMPEEISALRPLIRDPIPTTRAGREFIRGYLGTTPVVLAFSRWGKVAAASTATELILEHRVDRMVFCGIAGGLVPSLRIGDIVVADRLIQHDLDASPFFAPTQIPLLGIAALPTDPQMSAGLLAAASAFLAEDFPLLARGTGLIDDAPRRALRADIASGDQVIADPAARQRVLARVPTAVAVEMEGAAVAQVCFEHSVPFACFRTISDSADQNIHTDFPAFLAGLAPACAAGTLRRWLGV